MFRDCTGSNEVASGNLTFSGKVDFALTGTSEIGFWCEIASTPKLSFSFKNQRSGTKTRGTRARLMHKGCLLTFCRRGGVGQIPHELLSAGQIAAPRSV